MSSFLCLNHNALDLRERKFPWDEPTVPSGRKPRQKPNQVIQDCNLRFFTWVSVLGPPRHKRSITCVIPTEFRDLHSSFTVTLSHHHSIALQFTRFPRICFTRFGSFHPLDLLPCFPFSLFLPLPPEFKRFVCGLSWKEKRNKFFKKKSFPFSSCVCFLPVVLSKKRHVPFEWPA